MHRRPAPDVRLDGGASAHHCIKMRTTLTLADDVYQAAKTLAEGAGRPLGEVVSELIRRGLMPQGMQEKEGGLPLFKVPAGAEIIPGNRARELLSDEGME